jgi:predicted NBD/HSP70 family sugar kinase
VTAVPSAPLRRTTKALPADARRNNRALVLQTLFAGGPRSRADIARESGLTPVTVSGLVGELLATELLEEVGARPEARVGKPATLVRLRAETTTTAALDLSDDQQLRAALVDVGGHVLARRSRPWPGSRGRDARDLVLALARDLLAGAAHPVVGLGVAAPGIVDRSGVVLRAPNLDWTGVALADDLRAALGTPVHVLNDANAAALGVHSFGGADGAGSLVLTIGSGVGAGLLLDGRLLGGERSAAGELGHVTVTEDGELCSCGRLGCLETVLAVPRLRRRLAAAGAGRREAGLAAAGRLLGAALAPVVAALDLREVVLSGPVDLLDGTLRAALVQSVRQRTFAVATRELVVRLSPLGDDVGLVGAAAAVLTAELGVA